MAKVKGGLHSDSVGGAFGESMIFRKGKKSTTVTGYYKPGSAKNFALSYPQLYNRYKYSQIVMYWKALTTEQQEVFNENAKGTQMSGWNLYYKTAMENFANVLYNLTTIGGVIISDSAMKFDKVDSRALGVSIGAISKNNNFSISCWFKATDLTYTNYLVSNLNASADRVGLSVGTRISAYIYNGSSYIVSSRGSTVINPNIYYHAVLTFTPGAPKLYINGNLETLSATGSISPGTVSRFAVGATTNATTDLRVFSGLIPFVQIFNRVLLQEEITQIYNSGKNAYSPVTNGLVAQYSGKDYKGTAQSPTLIYDTKNFGNIFN